MCRDIGTTGSPQATLWSIFFRRLRASLIAVPAGLIGRTTLRDRTSFRKSGHPSGDYFFVAAASGPVVCLIDSQIVLCDKSVREVMGVLVTLAAAQSFCGPIMGIFEMFR